MGLRLLSSTFVDGGKIPQRYTCDGENLSPPLYWEDVPERAKSLALIAEDLDSPVGTICHWILYNIPPSNHELAEGIGRQEAPADGTQHGITTMQRGCYTGPCPPWGSHRYAFQLYALDTVLTPLGRMSRRRLRRIMEGRVLAQACLTGWYSRRRSG
jgi:hypothetical protein